MSFFNIIIKNYYANKIKKAINKANKPTASVKANVNNEYLKYNFSNLGFLDNEKTNEAKINPAPAPAPVKPIVAKPAPIFLDIKTNVFKKFDLY